MYYYELCFEHVFVLFCQQLHPNGMTLEMYEEPGLIGLHSRAGPVLDDWEVSRRNVIVGQLLSEGTFGKVYKGLIRGPLVNTKISSALRQAIGAPVAIKLLKGEISGLSSSCIHMCVHT